MALSERNAAILAERGLDAELLAKLGVADSGKPGFDVAIPYFVGGKIVNAKHRTIAGEKRFVQEAGAQKQFWNRDVISDPTLAQEPLIITEGEFDAIAAIQCGFARTVSVPDGAPAREIGDKETAKYGFLDSAPAALADVETIILATDGDEPGANLLHDLSLRLGRHRCKWVKYPKGCKDLNDALRLYGARGVTETIARALPYPIPGLYRMHELPPLPDRKAHRIGIPVLDDHYRLRPGDLTVVTGIPSMGKTSFVNDVCCRMAERWGWPTAFASFEQPPQTDHRRSLRSWFNRKRVVDQTQEEIAKADAWIDRMFGFIVPSDDDEVTLAWCLERCSSAIKRYGVKIVVVDPYNEMDHVRPPDMTLTEYTGFAIKSFKRLAKKHNVHVIIVAHPAKQRKLESGEYGIPSLYDISDSAHWYNKPDVGIVVHRGKDGDVIRIAKSRDHLEIGAPGDVPVLFNSHSCRYDATDTSEDLRAA